MEVTSALQRFFTENFILLKNFDERKKKLLKNKRQQMITRLLGMEKLATKFFKMHNVDKKHFDVWKSSILKPFWLNFMEVISLNSILVTT